MKENYYSNYLKNSETYKNLITAMDILDDYSKKLNILSKSFEDSSGSFVEEAKNEISDYIQKTNGFKDEIKKIFDGLNKNANKFDNVYNYWIQKIGEVINTSYEPESGMSSPKGTPFRKSVSIIKDVNVNEIGIINVITKTTIETRTVYSAGGMFGGRDTLVQSSYLFSNNCILNYSVSISEKKGGFPVSPYYGNSQIILTGNTDFIDYNV